MSNQHIHLSDIAGSSPSQGCTGMAAACSQQSDVILPMNWYCVLTKPQREKQAVEQLCMLPGVEVYFPRIRIRKTIRRVRRQVIEPLFPRYLFCRFDLTSNFRAVRYAHDVIDLVRFGSDPALVSDLLITELKSWVGEGDLIEAKPMFSSGDRVLIADGPMQGLQAVIQEAHSDRERVAVLLSILGCEVRLTIARNLLAKTA